MKIKSERDFWAGLLFIVFGVAFGVAATYRDMGPACTAGDPCAVSLAARFALMSAHPGPGFFPLGLGIVLALLGAAVLFKSLAIESFGGDPISPIAWRPLAFVIASLLLFCVAARSARAGRRGGVDGAGGRLRLRKACAGKARSSMRCSAARRRGSSSFASGRWRGRRGRGSRDERRAVGHERSLCAARRRARPARRRLAERRRRGDDRAADPGDGRSRRDGPR